MRAGVFVLKLRKISNFLRIINYNQHIIIDSGGLLTIQTYPLGQTKYICPFGKRIVVYGSRMIVACRTTRQQIICRSKTPSLIIDKGKVLGMIITVAADQAKQLVRFLCISAKIIVVSAIFVYKC